MGQKEYKEFKDLPVTLQQIKKIGDEEFRDYWDKVGLKPKKPTKMNNLDREILLYWHNKQINLAFEAGILQERKVCRDIFINNVDWSEWSMSEKDAGERFDEERLKISG